MSRKSMTPELDELFRGPGGLSTAEREEWNAIRAVLRAVANLGHPKGCACIVHEELDRLRRLARASRGGRK